MASFLTYGDWTCHHEMALYMRSMDDARRLLVGATGCVETGAILGWRLIAHHVPGIRMAVVRRPIEDAVRAMMQVKVSGVASYDESVLLAGFRRGARALDEIALQPGVLALDYADLGTKEGCAALFEHCLPYRFDDAWWERRRLENVQADVKGVLQYYFAHRAEVESFKRDCMREMSRLVRAGLIGRRRSSHAVV